jgi:hypothetical protein
MSPKFDPRLILSPGRKSASAVIMGSSAYSVPSDMRFAPAALGPDDPRLQQRVNEDREAVISGWMVADVFRRHPRAAKRAAHGIAGRPEISDPV